MRSLESNNKTTLATLKTHQSLLEVIEKATMELSSTLLTFSSNRNWHGNSEAEES